MAIKGVTLGDFLNNPVEATVHPLLVIPEYQRPYAWERDDQAQKLFADILDYANDTAGEADSEPYFLGTIVGYYKKTDNELEIIDGQQRITTLFLLLRAIYTRLETEECGTNQNKKKIIQHFMDIIAQALWKTKFGQPDFDSASLITRADSGNEILQKILQTGTADASSKDNFSQNYLLFQEKLRENFGCQIVEGAYSFFEALLKKTIVLPVIADNEDTALRIFTTLNDRGMPLSDADIFKAQIYRRLANDKKDEFIERWQRLSENAALGGKDIQDLFTYYMFYLRASKNDTNTSSVAMRKYYAGPKGDFLLLQNPRLMDDLETIAELLKIMNRNQDAESPLEGKMPVLQILDAFNYYPNEFGKYSIIIFYLAHHSKPGFSETYLAFLKKFIALATMKFALEPSVNSIKGEGLKLNAAIIGSMHPVFDFGVQPQMAKDALKTPNAKMVQLLLCLLAYIDPDQKELLKQKWQIEHILPQSQKWQEVFLKGVPKNEIKEWVENFGNKIPLEGKINATASDDCFRIKKYYYGKSKIAMANKLAQDPSLGNWDFDKIKARNEAVVNELVNAFRCWNDEYDKIS